MCLAATAAPGQHAQMLHVLSLLCWKGGCRCLQDQGLLLEVSKIQGELWEFHGETLLPVRDRVGWQALSAETLEVEESKRCWVDEKE